MVSFIIVHFPSRLNRLRFLNRLAILAECNFSALFRLFINYRNLWCFRLQPLTL